MLGSSLPQFPNFLGICPTFPLMESEDRAWHLGLSEFPGVDHESIALYLPSLHPPEGDSVDVLG